MPRSRLAPDRTEAEVGLPCNRWQHELALGERRWFQQSEPDIPGARFLSWRIRQVSRPSPPATRCPSWHFAAFSALLLGAKLWLIGSYGNATPYWDQWDSEAALFYQPYLDGTLRWTNFIAPHCEHALSQVALLALAGLLTVNGT